MTQQELKYKCPSCTSLVRGWARFCPKCGARLHGSSVHSARVIRTKEQSALAPVLDLIYQAYKILLAAVALAGEALILPLRGLARNLDDLFDPTIRLLFVALGLFFIFFIALILTLVYR